MTESKPQKRFILIFEKIIYLLAVIFSPSIYLFHLFNINIGQNLYFSAFVYLGLFLSVLSLIAYFVLRKLSNPQTALIFIPICWILFWFINRAHYFFYGKTGSLPPSVGTLTLLLILLALFTFLFMRLRRCVIDKIITNTLAIMIVVLFFYNFFPSIPFTGFFAEKPCNGKAYDLKTEFVVDDSLPKPNIYWIHTDGMMGFDAVEKYCGDAQSEFRDSLSNKGFVINPSAKVEAGSTSMATPSLLSPTFYDSYMANRLKRMNELGRIAIKDPYNKDVTFPPVSDDGFSMFEIYDNEEVLKAFEKIGYINYTFFSTIYGILPMNLYRNSSNIEKMIKESAIKNLTLLADLMQNNHFLLNKIFNDLSFQEIEGTELSSYQDTVDKIIPKTSAEESSKRFVRVLSESLEIESPKFAYLWMLTPHAAFAYEENGEVNSYIKEQYAGIPERDEVTLSSPELYYPQHKYTTKILEKSIDLIIDTDPEAIIVIQSDHGIHMFSADWMRKHGYTDEQMEEMWFSTMSAVRIPEKYGKLTEPLEPLNISRWLVNNFVGENYEYID